jgi:hypothetical protein
MKSDVKGLEPVKPEKKDHEEWEIKDAFDTLLRAKEIEADPTKMERVHKLAGRKKKAITSIQDLRDRRDELFKPKKKKAEMDE